MYQVTYCDLDNKNEVMSLDRIVAKFPGEIYPRALEMKQFKWVYFTSKKYGEVRVTKL